MPPLAKAKAGIGVSLRPSLMTCSRSDWLTIARNSRLFSGRCRAEGSLLRRDIPHNSRHRGAELQHLLGRRRLIGRVRFAGHIAAGEEQQARGRGDNESIAHDFRPPPRVKLAFGWDHDL